jgi:hypothetical protein
MLRYKIPLQCTKDDIYYYESEEMAEMSLVSLQYRIDTFLGDFKDEQYPHMIGKYEAIHFK